MSQSTGETISKANSDETEEQEITIDYDNEDESCSASPSILCKVNTFVDPEMEIKGIGDKDNNIGVENSGISETYNDRIEYEEQQAEIRFENDNDAESDSCSAAASCNIELEIKGIGKSIVVENTITTISYRKRNSNSNNDDKNEGDEEQEVKIDKDKDKENGSVSGTVTALASGSSNTDSDTVPQIDIKSDDIDNVNNDNNNGVGVAVDSKKDTFSVAHAIDALGFGKFQVILSLLTGLCWMSDSMEMTILSILAPALHCKLCIDKYQQAFLTNAVFMGMMISSPFWGNLSDRYGRRKALWASVGVLFFYGAVSAFSTGYYWLLFFRFFVGFAIGCTPQSVTLYAEFLPSKQRARCVVLLDCFWALGACLEVLLALLVMPTLGWQWLLGLSSVPIFFFFIMCYWLPESVRYLACAGQTEKAMTTLERIAEDNKRPMLLGRLVVDDMHPMQRGRFKDLIRPEMRRTTLLLWFIWMSCAFCYYGVVFLSTEIFEQNDARDVAKYTSTNATSFSTQMSSITTEAAMSIINNSTTSDAIDGVCDPDRKDCAMLNTSDYVGLLWITLAEFPGILTTIFILDRIGRKKTMGVQFLLFAATIFAFIFHIEDRLMTTVILFLARGIVAGVFQAAYVYTPEVYPTSMRAIGIGTCSSMARIGAMLTPYVAQVLSQSSRPLAAACYGIAAILAALLTMLLPIETKGKALPD